MLLFVRIFRLKYERERERERVSIFLASDDNYAPFVATTIASICNNTYSNIDFYILDGGIFRWHKKLIKETLEKFNDTNNFTIEFIRVDVDVFAIEIAELTTHFTKSMFNRFLIPSLKQNITKAIYLDVDVIVIDDIVKLWNENLEGKIIGAVNDTYFSKFKNTHPIAFSPNRLAISSEHKFFNSGVLLMDCEKWRENNITENLFSHITIYNKIIETAKNDELGLFFYDQDILNKVFDNNYKQLPIRYNMAFEEFKYLDDDFWRKNFENERIQMVIRHYSDREKPWKSDMQQDTDLFWYYTKMTPFYDKIKQNYDKEISKKKIKIKVFNMFTIFKIISKNGIRSYYLLDFIPLLKVKKEKNRIEIKILGISIKIIK